jgi:hypothetical protein
VQLHSDDLKVELAVLEAKEADEARRSGEGRTPDVVVDLDAPTEDWENLSVEEALGAETDERPKRPGDGTDEDEDEEIIVEIEEE